MDTPRIKVEHWPLDKIKPNPKNPKIHSEEQIDKIAASIIENRFTNPILIDEGGIIMAGHGRLKAAYKLKRKDAPVILLAGMTDAQKKRYMILDNKLAEFGTSWDEEALHNLLSEIQEENGDIIDLGFSDAELKTLQQSMDLGGGGGPGGPKGASGVKDSITEKDDLISKDIPKRVQLGDLWKLGDHFMLCGDSTNETDVNALIIACEKNPTLMVTDPPYGVNYDPGWRERAGKGVGEHSKGKVKNDHIFDWSESYNLFSGDVAYVWHSAKYSNKVIDSLMKHDFEIISQIIWNKQTFSLSRGDYHWKHEPCWYVVRKGKNHNWQGSRNQSTVWEIKNNGFGNANKEERHGHGTQKPIDCMLIPILNNSKKDQWVYDPFAGTGTTLIGCEKSKRKCITMELEPRYCDIVLKRFEDYTDIEPELIKNLYTKK